MPDEIISQSKNKSVTTRPRWLWIISVAILGCAAACFAIIWSAQPRFTDDQYEAECRRLTEAADWEQLERFAQDWIDDSASLPDLACLFQADAQMQLGKNPQAIENLRRIPRTSTKAFSSLIVACNLQFGEMNQPQEGVETLKLMIDHRPSSISSHQRLIYYYAITLQRNLMLDAIYNAIANRAEPPDAYVYLMLADHLNFTNGFEQNTEWLRSSRDEIVFQAARLVQLIENLQSSENPKAAATADEYHKTLIALREKHPANIVLLRFSIEQAVKEFDIDRVAELVSLIPADNRDSVLLRLRGWLKFEQGQFDECEKLLEQSIVEFSMDWHTWQELARCRRRLGKLESAKDASTTALMGKSIRKEMLQLTNAAAISTDQLQKIAAYAARCGMKPVSDAMLYRLQIRKQIPHNPDAL